MTKALVQRPAPDFEATMVQESMFEKVKLSDRDGWTVLLFFPMAFTFVCPTELLAFASRRKEFEAIGCSVFGVSTDSEYALLAWTNMKRDDGGLGPDFDLPLISDKSHRISADYGVLLPDEGVALRGLFIIDPKGILRQVTINDVSVGRSVDEALRLVKAFQFTDKHGEVCPAGWDETNSQTIKPDPAGSKAYFSRQAKRAANGNHEADAKRAKISSA